MIPGVESLGESAVSDALALCATQLGTGLHSRATFVGEHHIPLGIHIDNKLVACCVAVPHARLALRLRIPEPYRDLFSTWHLKLGMIQAVAVHPDFGGQGLARQLLLGACRVLEGAEQDQIAMIGWMPGGKPSAFGLPLKLGFTSVCTMPEYRPGRSLQLNHQCPVCGDPPCHCNAEVLLRCNSVSELRPRC